MRLAVFSHKVCWPDPASAGRFDTDGGFPFQMRALSELFDATVLLMPCTPGGADGGSPLLGHNLSIIPLSLTWGRGALRKLLFPLWFLANFRKILTAIWNVDAIHAPIPGDVGTIGMVAALVLRKPLFVRHCGNWLRPRTLAERFWRWFMETFAGGRNVMLATGGAAHAPSKKSPLVRWIFSTSLTQEQLSQYGDPRSHPPTQRLRLCHVARQDSAKGAGVVIQALPALLPQYPELRFSIVGEGAGISEFRHSAKELGVARNVVFCGKLAHREVMRVLAESDIFCFPTGASDGFPKAVLEGLASGLPLVATDVSVLPQLLQHGCGALMKERSPEAFVAAVRQVLSTPDNYETMSRQAIQTAKAYSLEAWRDTIREHLESAWGPLRREKGRSRETGVRKDGDTTRLLTES